MQCATQRLDELRSESPAVSAVASTTWAPTCVAACELAYPSVGQAWLVTANCANKTKPISTRQINLFKAQVNLMSEPDVGVMRVKSAAEERRLCCDGRKSRFANGGRVKSPWGLVAEP